MSRVKIRPWTSSRLSVAISVAAPREDQRPAPALRTSTYMPSSAIVPKMRLPSRQANGPSPKSSIDAATMSLAPCGCSALGSVPSGELS